jgi:4-amino-4-deoxy-L-arabinose transferase-like glycosyltransferase
VRERAPWRDWLWLALAVLTIIGSGFGWRDPWPADEPRFALIARDMVASGDWLFPRVGGDLYPDKPPVFFWLLAVSDVLLGSVRWSFLLPSLLAASGTLALVYDLTRRLAKPEAALPAALLLCCCVQFAMVARGAQIDAVLCFLTTLSLYGLLRHLLAGPEWGWYFVGGFAAGIGVATKGVGFLPLLLLLPYPLLRRASFEPLPRFAGGARWLLAPIGLAVGLALWLVPMLLAIDGHADLAAYRDEILFRQTVDRYASAWHHLKPWYYFLIEVIPGLWLPFSLLLFWLVPRWRGAWRARDARVWLPLSWALLTLAFFSLSPGKRGVYVLPVLPAMILAAAPFLPQLLRQRGPQRAALTLSAVLIVAIGAVTLAHALGLEALLRETRDLGLRTVAPLAIASACAAAFWIGSRTRAPLLVWPATLAAIAVTWGYGIAPQIDAERSARRFARELQSATAGRDLGLLAYKEQFLLQLKRPSVNFGHARWQEGAQEAQDAALWLNAAPNRVLLIPASQRDPCFSDSPARSAGRSGGDEWQLIESPASVACARGGDPARAIHYRPPGSG